METTQQDQDFGNSKNNSSSSYLCRQSSTRWTPTSDQIRILKELYYNNGIRSPTADQIQRIAARLRHYGKIEGKNVFYWFQNHKARERQKKRFTPAPVLPPPPPPSTTVLPSPISDHHHMHVQSNHIPYFYNHHHQQQLRLHAAHHMISTPAEAGSSSSSSSQAFMPVGCGFGSLAMEKSFRECSISPGESKIPGNFGTCVGVDSYSLEKNKIEISERHDHEEDPEDVDDDGGGELSGEIETLPLFPIHGGSTRHDIFKTTESVMSPEHSNGGYYSRGNWFRSDGSRSSLELSLNSYGYYN